MNYKKDFPIFNKKINGKDLIYLDSAATSQKPQAVLDAMEDYYKTYNANVKRGIYPIAEKATLKIEEARKKVARFINAKYPEEIIFVRNTTEAINLVAYAYGSKNITAGDTVATTIMEHHSNFVPWQQLAKNKKAKFEVVDIDNNFQFLIFNFQSKANFQKVKLLAITHVSNVLATINPLKEIIKQAKIINPNLIVIVDGAQSVPHMKVDVQDMDCDFMAFSGHKMMAGTGIGVLYGKREILQKMPPFLFGGEMIQEVTVEETTFASLPHKFEAGTPDIAGIISLGAAVDYLEKVGMENVRKHEREIVAYSIEKMGSIKGITIYGQKSAEDRGGVIAFNLNGIHPHDIAQILGDKGICIRAGHHCTMPLHKRLGIAATARASFSLYNNEKDIDQLIEGLKDVQKIFSSINT